MWMSMGAIFDLNHYYSSTTWGYTNSVTLPERRWGEVHTRSTHSTCVMIRSTRARTGSNRHKTTSVSLLPARDVVATRKGSKGHETPPHSRCCMRGRWQWCERGQKAVKPPPSRSCMRGRWGGMNGVETPKGSLHIALACEVVAARTGSKLYLNHLHLTREVVGKWGGNPLVSFRRVC